MDDFAGMMRRERAVGALLPLFFVSGATALVYQTIWARDLHLVFGTSTFAIATVLAAFMCGLALGGFAMGRYADGIVRPLRAYGLLEIGIGAYALLFPTLIRWVTPIYLAVHQSLDPGPVLYGLIQFFLVGTTLILPTAFMGATLPLLARFATERLGAAGDRVGTLYSVNTAGAVFGTWFAGFVLLPAVGLWWSTVLAAIANLVLGVAAVFLDSWAGERDRVEVLDDLDFVEPMRPALVPVAIAMAGAGFASLVYEVAWTRLMGLMLGASVYAFSTMLLAFLVGIALGGKMGGYLGDWTLRRYGQEGVLQTLAVIEIAVGALSVAMMWLYGQLPYFYVELFDLFNAEEHPMMMWVTSTALAALVMTPPAVLMGIAFPVAVRAVVGNDEHLGGPVGIIYGANTLGGVFGAFLAGFVFLPGLWLQSTVLVAALANLSVAVLLIAHTLRGKPLGREHGIPVAVGLLGVGFFVFQPPWNAMLMTAGMYKYVSHFEDHSREGIYSYAVHEYELLFYAEGLSSVVTVAKNKDSDNIWLANNGKVDASTSTDMPTQVLCSLLPMQFVDTPKDVLVIGLASGVTAGAVTLIPDMERMDIVELEPAIEEAARVFDEHNHHVLDDPRTRLVNNDGRNFVLLSEEGQYDVIISEPSNPWITGVSNLFTREFFALGKSRLKPGGVWSQWVQMYGMDEHDLRTLLATFADVYPYVLVYATIEDSDLVLIGSESEIQPSPERAQRLLDWPEVSNELELIDMYKPLEFVAIYQMGRDEILEISKGVTLNTDDNMKIEYSAPMHIHTDTQDENFRLLTEAAVVPYQAMPDDPLLLSDLARVYQDREDVVRSVATMAHAAGMLPKNDPLREDMISQAETWQAELLEQLEDEED